MCPKGLKILQFFREARFSTRPPGRTRTEFWIGAAHEYSIRLTLASHGKVRSEYCGLTSESASGVLRSVGTDVGHAWEHHFPSALAVLLRSQLRAHATADTTYLENQVTKDGNYRTHSPPHGEPDR